MDIFALAIENFCLFVIFPKKPKRSKVCWPLDMRRSIVFAMLDDSSLYVNKELDLTLD